MNILCFLCIACVGKGMQGVILKNNALRDAIALVSVEQKKGLFCKGALDIFFLLFLTGGYTY